MPNPVSAILSHLSDLVITVPETAEQKLQQTLLIFAFGLMGFAAMLSLVIYTSMVFKTSATVPRLSPTFWASIRTLSR